MSTALSIVPSTDPNLAKARRYTAITLLRRRGDRLANELASTTVFWKKEIADSVAELDALCDPKESPKPATLKERGERLDQIYEVKKERDRAKAGKAKACGDIQALIEANEQAIDECFAAKPNGAQQPLPLGDRRQVADGLELTPGTLELIDAAAREVLTSAGSKNAPDIDDIRDLATAIAMMGIDGSKFVPATSDAVVADDKPQTDESGADGDGPESDVPF